jgi:anti-sigma factor RsiW
MSHLGAIISALLDGELSPAEAAEADAHLLACPSCRAELRATRQARDLLRQLPTMEWTPAFFVRRSHRPAFALAAVAAVALVGVVAWPASRSTAPPLARVVQAGTLSALTAGSVATVPPAAVGAPFRAPDALPGGYRRVGMYRQDGDLHALYRSGGSSLVVFEQPAHLDRKAMPPGGELVSLGSWMGVAYAWPGGHAVTWQRDGTVYTVVGDGPTDDVITAAGSLPAPRPLSLRQRVRRACRGMVEAFSGLL